MDRTVSQESVLDRAEQKDNKQNMEIVRGQFSEIKQKEKIDKGNTEHRSS